MDNTSLINFNFQDRPLRVVDIDGEPWFVAKDVAGALGYEKFDTHLIDKVPEEWKGTKPIRTPGGIQQMLCLSEPGLYFFLGRSDKPLSLPYQKWIAGDVVPSIRKKGFYAAPGKDREEQDEWKKNFPYPFLLLENAAVKMREMRLGIDKGLVDPREYRRVVFGDFSPAEKTDAAVIGFVKKNVTITGSEDDFIPLTGLYACYQEQTAKPCSWNILVRKIRASFPALVYKQKKIDGYPALVFLGCRLKTAAALAEEALKDEGDTEAAHAQP